MLGDQLDREAPLLKKLDPARDAVWMAEVPGEAEAVWSHKVRIALFLSAMRHFRDDLAAWGMTVHYWALGEHPHPSLQATLAAELSASPPSVIRVTQPGEHRVLQALRATASAMGVPFEVWPDQHFLFGDDFFGSWATGRKALRMEHFYRTARRATGVLMEGDEPAGGHWNFDTENRKTFGRHGPPPVPTPSSFPPDAVTRQALKAVETHFPDHPGSLARFDWPVTPTQARSALAEFVAHRLPHFGAYQDAMWTGEPYLFHSRLSAALNLKLIPPREALSAAEAAYRNGLAPLASVEGFARQIMGWREYVRGLYWRNMPDWLDWNVLGAEAPLPAFYWTGDTAMACLQATIGQTLERAYAHHIQRLMVTGLFALLAGVQPRAVHEWYLAVYADAVEWVELPNTLGMSQYADGGLMASKPYVASGRYIQRMSNYCRNCPFEPGQTTGEGACPFTTLYWAFLDRHRERFAGQPRTALQWRNLQRLSASEVRAIRSEADRLLANLE
ncbi:cryptochrome/photolyase family protein [Thiohalorhabdus denitrificans]|uniref:cryptochrome/photolyase family protein n=1 Tax=Thiohalorhabdus denitrificans TaxID=381306 RepID=UPI0009EAB492|nr:cryptochrome/photolyase family protein [Thiohalorhabdus denitrificans]